MKDKDGWTPLHIASSNGYIETVKYLIEQCHANADAKDNFGMTPVQCASTNNRITVAGYLMQINRHF